MSAAGSRCSASKMLGLQRDRSGSVRASAPGIGAWDMAPSIAAELIPEDEWLQPRAARSRPSGANPLKGTTVTMPTGPRTALAAAAVVAAGLAPTIPLFSTPASAAPGGPGWVTGVVVDDAGNPVEGALVNVLGPSEVPGLELIDETTDKRAVTDDQGRFRVRQDGRGFLVQVCDVHPDAPTSATRPGATT